MTENKKNVIYLILAIMFFYLCWGIPQFFEKYNLLSTTLNNWFFSIAGFFITVLFNTLSESKYNDYSMVIVISGTALSLIIVINDILSATLHSRKLK